jgi:hypothetical protein
MPRSALLRERGVLRGRRLRQHRRALGRGRRCADVRARAALEHDRAGHDGALLRAAAGRVRRPRLFAQERHREGDEGGERLLRWLGGALMGVSRDRAGVCTARRDLAWAGKGRRCVGRCMRRSGIADADEPPVSASASCMRSQELHSWLLRLPYICIHRSSHTCCESARLPPGLRATAHSAGNAKLHLARRYIDRVTGPVHVHMTAAATQSPGLHIICELGEAMHMCICITLDHLTKTRKRWKGGEEKQAFQL